MNKLFTKIAALALGAAMVVGVGVSVGSKSIVEEANADNYSYTFTSKQFAANETKSLGGVSWTLSGNGNYWNYDGTKGQQFGSGNAPYKSLSLSTSGISGTISQIVVNASGASSVNATISCTVGGSAFGTQSQSISTTASNKTFSGSASGTIDITMSQTSSKALYIKTISVTYSTAQNYSVTFYGNGNTGGSMSSTQTSGSSYKTPTVDECGFTKTDYVLSKWALNSASGTQYNPGDTITGIKANISLYAIWVIDPSSSWIKDTFTITDLGISGSSYTAFSVTDQSDATYVGYAAKNNSNMQFNTFDNQKNRSIATSVSGGKIKRVSVTWGDAGTRYLTVYVSNSPYSATSTGNVGTAQSKTLSSSNTTVDITGDFKYVSLYPNGAIYPASVSFYWEEPQSYTVSFQMNGHGSAVPQQTIKEGGKVTRPATDPTDTAYNFVNWYKDSNLQTLWNFSTDTVSGTTTIYAKWTIKQYTVTFDVQGHGTAPQAQTVDHGSTATIPESDPTAQGYEFGGWYAESTYQNEWNFSTEITEDTIIYAKWTPTATPYHVTDSLNNASLSSTADVIEHAAVSLTITADEHYTLPASITVTMGGNAFSSYTYTRASGNRTATFTIAANIVEGDLVFSGSAIQDTKYSVTYVAGTNGTGQYVHNVQYYAGQSHELLAYADLTGISTTSSYKFKDYTVESETKTPGQSITINGATTVIVNFEAKPTEIEFNFPTIAVENNWENGVAYTEVENDGVVITAKGGENNGKWYTSSGGSWRMYSGGQVVISANGATITSVTSNPECTFSINGDTATFSPSARTDFVSIIVTVSGTPTVNYSVTYDNNGGTGNMTDPDSPYSANSSVTTLENEFTREGYTFDHWNTAADDKGTSYTENETFTITGNTTLYAIWEENGGGETVAARCYSLVTSTSQLTDGAKYIIASDSETAMAEQRTNNRGEASISVSSSVAVVTTDNVQVVTLEASGSNWNFNVGDGYLFASSSSKNYLHTETEPDENGNADFAISFSGEVASIVAQGNSTHNDLRYNSSSGLFSCYASGQNDVYLYRLDFEETLIHNVKCDGDGAHSLPDGYTWNVDLKAVFDDLPLSERNALRDATSPGAGLVRYDYIIGKYNRTGETDASKTNYVHFINGRTITPVGAGRIILDPLGISDGNPTAIIIIVSAIGVSALGGFFFLRKRKEI